MVTKGELCALLFSLFLVLIVLKAVRSQFRPMVWVAETLEQFWQFGSQIESPMLALAPEVWIEQREGRTTLVAGVDALFASRGVVVAVHRVVIRRWPISGRIPCDEDIASWNDLATSTMHRLRLEALSFRELSVNTFTPCQRDWKDRVERTWRHGSALATLYGDDDQGPPPLMG